MKIPEPTLEDIIDAYDKNMLTPETGHMRIVDGKCCAAGAWLCALIGKDKVLEMVPESTSFMSSGNALREKLEELTDDPAFVSGMTLGFDTGDDVTAIKDPQRHKDGMAFGAKIFQYYKKLGVL